jgi:hypothetical protein
MGVLNEKRCKIVTIDIVEGEEGEEGKEGEGEGIRKNRRHKVSFWTWICCRFYFDRY